MRLEPSTEKTTLYPKENQHDFNSSFMSSNFNVARAYAIAPLAAKKLLDGSKKWSMPVDNYIDSIYLHGVACYLLTPSIILDVEVFDTTIHLNEESKANGIEK